MTLPPVPRSRTRRRELWERFAVSPMRGLTEWLMAGDDIVDDDELHELRALRRQCEAFITALDARVLAAERQGIVIEAGTSQEDE